MNSIIQGFPQSNDNMFLSYKFLEMGAACVLACQILGCVETEGDGTQLQCIIFCYSIVSHTLFWILHDYILFSEMSQCQHLLRDTGPVRKSSWPGGVRYDHGAGRGWRGRLQQQQLMSVIDFAGCGTVTVRRTSDSSTTTHSFLHHATKTQQLNLETVSGHTARGTVWVEGVSGQWGEDGRRWREVLRLGEN